MKKSYKHLFQILTFVALIMVAVGCSSNKSEETSNNEDTKTEDTTEGYPITIKHVFGETVIEEKPERVAAIA